MDSSRHRSIEPDRISGERAALEQWLDYHRATLLMKCAGLTATQLDLEFPYDPDQIGADFHDSAGNDQPGREPARQRNRRAVGGRHVWFTTGECSRTSVSTDEFDLVVEGTAEQVTDPVTVAKLSVIWAAGGWPARPDDTGEALTAESSVPSVGPPPWQVYRLTAHSATPIATIGPGGATRWHF